MWTQDWPVTFGVFDNAEYVVLDKILQHPYYRIEWRSMTRNEWDEGVGSFVFDEFVVGSVVITANEIHFE